MDLSDKQVQIINTAEELFAEKGYDGTSVRDIADVAGVNVAMISYYFGSKEKLLEALMEVRVGTVKTRVETLIKDESMSPIQKLNMLVDEHIERVCSSHSFHRIIQGVLVTNKNPSIVEMAIKIKMRSANVVNELIKDGQKKGVFRKNVDVMLMMNTMVGTVTQTLMNKEYYRRFHNQENLSDEQFITQLRRKLSIHIKSLFKVILTNEA